MRIYTDICDALARKLMHVAIAQLNDTDPEWAKAISYEFISIATSKEALRFAFGCAAMGFKQKLKSEHGEPLGRNFIVCCLVLWTGAKLYLARNMVTEMTPALESTGLHIGLSLAALMYLGAGISLYKKHWRGFCLCLIVVFGFNSYLYSSLLHALIQDQTSHYMAYRLAIILEDYIIILMTVIGGFTLWYWPQYFTRKHRGLS